MTTTNADTSETRQMQDDAFALRNYGREMARFKAKNTGAEVVIRYPRWEDLKQFHAYLNQVHQESLEEPMWFSTRPHDLPQTSRRLAENLKKVEVAGHPFLFVEVEGQIVGQGWVWIGGPNFGADIGYLGLELTKATRGMGIGTKLFEILEAESKNAGAVMIELTMASANRACQLYERLGYKEVGRIPHAVMSNYGKEKWDDRADLVYMIKYL
ncbi:N-acetyltransferase family protein [Phycisphaerales bacterium AB-hyl4]|uniref:N-acetyltransferase family protein n=1 Tax=Natronomicrosphaera hydrolytica TaxID=3242702 RepID=A0ABV4U526_9BACT